MLTVTAPASGSIAPPGYYQAVAVDSTGTPSRGYIISLGSALPAPNLVAHYPFDQTSGTTVNDVSGNAKHGTLVGGASWVAGRVGSNAIRLTGSNQYVDLPDAAGSGLHRLYLGRLGQPGVETPTGAAFSISARGPRPTCS